MSSSFRFAAPLLPGSCTVPASFLPRSCRPDSQSRSPTWLPGFLVTHHIRQFTCNALCCISTTCSAPSHLPLLSSFDSCHPLRMDGGSLSGHRTESRATAARPRRTLLSTKPVRAWGPNQGLCVSESLHLSTSAYILRHNAIAALLLLYTTAS